MDYKLHSEIELVKLSNKIVNLSDYKPSPYELAILEKDLSFCQSKKIDEIQFFSYI